MRPYCEAVTVDVRRRLSPPHRQSVAQSVWLGSCGSSWLSCLQGRTTLESLRNKPRLIVRAEAAVLVDHVQKLESAAISSGIELAVHGPHVLEMLGPGTPHQAIGGPCPLSLPGSRPLQAFLPPEPLHPPMVQRPDLPSGHPLGHPTAPAHVVSGDLAEKMPQLGLLQVDDLAVVALAAIDILRYLQRTSHGVAMACESARMLQSEVSLSEVAQADTS